MMAVKRGHTMTTRAILDFGVNPTIFLRKDADGSTPLHIAVQNTNTFLAELLLQYGPTEQLYTENSVGQTPLEIAGLKFLPRVMGSIEARLPKVPCVDVSSQVQSLKSTAPFDVEKQKVEIPKLRATLDALVADGRLVYGTKLATELFAFAGRMEEKLAIEIARKDAAKDSNVKEEDSEVDHRASHGTTARVYALLRDATAVRSGRRQLVHLADVQRSVQRSLAAQQVTVWTAPPSWGHRTWESKEEEPEQPDPEKQRIARLQQRSLFRFEPMNPRFFGYRIQINLFGPEPALAPMGVTPGPGWCGRGMCCAFCGQSYD
jgi:hypothetical protein